jgi:hypothetical protein
VSKRMEEKAADELGKEVRRLLRQHLAAPRVGEDVLDPSRPQQVRDGRFAFVDAPLGLLRVGGVRDPVLTEGVRRTGRRGLPWARERLGSRPESPR